nr:DUF551 domain-containing protein [Klebsiella pneumoniae]
MSEFSRETLLNIIETDHVQCGEASALARMALAAMDSEPVILYRERNPYNGLTTGWQELTENEFSFLKENAGENAEFLTLYRHAQQPVVPEEWTIADAVKFCKETGRQDAGAAMDAWNACRAAMLQVSPVCTCPSGDGSLRWPCPVHPGNSPAQSDCCPAQNSVNPAQGGNYLVIPDEMTSEQAYEIGYYYGDPVDVFARGANWMRQHIIDSTLAAAPQLPGSEPATVPGKWIPVSERIPDNTEPVLCIEKRADFGTYGQPFVCWHDGGGWVGKTNYRPIVTHWMPLPAGPQEVTNGK